MGSTITHMTSKPLQKLKNGGLRNQSSCSQSWLAEVASSISAHSNSYKVGHMGTEESGNPRAGCCDWVGSGSNLFRSRCCRCNALRSAAGACKWRPNHLWSRIQLWLHRSQLWWLHLSHWWLLHVSCSRVECGRLARRTVCSPRKPWGSVKTRLRSTLECHCAMCNPTACRWPSACARLWKTIGI